MNTKTVLQLHKKMISIKKPFLDTFSPVYAVRIMQLCNTLVRNGEDGLITGMFKDDETGNVKNYTIKTEKYTPAQIVIILLSLDHCVYTLQELKEILKQF